MAMVVVDDSCLQADSQPKSARWLGLIVDGRLCAILQFIKWIEWTLAMTCGHDDRTINTVQGLLLLLLLLLLRMLTAKFYASSLIRCSVVYDPCPWFIIFIYRNGHVKILGLIDWLVGNNVNGPYYCCCWCFHAADLFFHISACYAGFPQGFPTRNMLWIAGVRIVTRRCFSCHQQPQSVEGRMHHAWAPHVNEVCQKVVDIWIVNMWNANWPLEPELSLLSANKKT